MLTKKERCSVIGLHHMTSSLNLTFALVTLSTSIIVYHLPSDHIPTHSFPLP